jgi:hypothetical protein
MPMIIKMMNKMQECNKKAGEAKKLDK